MRAFGGVSANAAKIEGLRGSIEQLDDKLNEMSPDLQLKSFVISSTGNISSQNCFKYGRLVFINFQFAWNQAAVDVQIPSEYAPAAPTGGLAFGSGDYASNGQSSIPLVCNISTNGIMSFSNWAATSTPTYGGSIQCVYPI